MNKRLHPSPGVVLGIAVLVVSSFSVSPARTEEAPRPRPGEVVEIPFAPLGTDLKIWLPPDHGEDPERRWPIWLYYHGTGGRPTVGFPLQAVRRGDWVVVGMTYRKRGRFDYSHRNLAAEREIYHELLRTWNRDHALQLDPEKVFVGGFSKGGWLAGLFLESDPILAGAIVLGAGASSRSGEVSPRPFDSPRSVYVGVGESDGNLGMSHRAREHFKRLGGRVTLDVWPDCGHALPRSAPTFLRQWLRLRAARPEDEFGIRAEAVEWMDDTLREIADGDDPVEAYFALDRLRDAPWYPLADREITTEITERLARLGSGPQLHDEIRARDRFHQILAVETRDRYLKTLRQVNGDYALLAEKFPDTRFGKKAALSRDRTAAMLPPGG